MVVPVRTLLKVQLVEGVHVSTEIQVPQVGSHCPQQDPHGLAWATQILETMETGNWVSMVMRAGAVYL